METATENKLTYDEQQTLIILCQNEIESLKKNNLLLTDDLATAKINCGVYQEKFNIARDKGNKAINDLEIVRYWMWIREAAMAITILGFIVYHVIK